MSILLQIGVKSESLLHNRIPAATNGLDAVEVALAAAEDEAAYHPPPQPTYASCYGLPYQDHNYGAPPPPTPPASPPPLVTKLNGHIEVEDLGSTAVVTTTETFPEVPPPSEPVDDSITRCICNFQHDDGYMICCDKCGVWQHVDCMGVDRANIPDTYRCELCEPRKVDKNRAILIQTRKREELSVGSSTESETETKQGALKKGKKTKMAVRDLERFKKRNLIKREKKTSPIQKENRKLLKKELTPKKPVVRALKGNRSNSAPASQNTVPPNNIVEKYEEAHNNRYSPNVQNILASRKTNGAHSHVGESKSSAKLLDQLCTVAQISANAKGLEASEDLSSNQGIVEYRGHVKLRDQIDKENGTDPLPFILYYTKFDDLQLCVDARVYGNDARYIRRSCCPNAEVRHVLENGKLFFFIYSSKSIPKGAEVTIPFDFNLHTCKKLVDCPCARASCPVARKRRRLDLQNQKAMKKQKRASKSSDCTPAAPAPPVADELPVSTVPTRRRRRSSPSRAPPLPQPPAEPVETKTPKSPVKEPVPQKVEETAAPLPVSPDVKHETDEGGEPRKKMTREERKMEAIMKAFEKLEKREERRKEALARLEHVKKKEEKVVKVEPPETQEVPDTAETVPEEKPPVEVKSEKPKHVVKGKKGRKGHGTPARRRSRYNSCSSGVETTASLSAEENSSHATQPTTPVPVIPVTPVPAEPMPSQPVTPLGFRFPKTKKQMMSEWLSESGQEVQKPLTIKTEPLEVNTNTEEEEMAEYVKCLPSPHTTLNHLRRNSLSSSQKECTATRAAPTLDTRRGSAKKRWLRQAMCESGGTSSPVQGSFSPLHSGALSPNPQAPQNSPGASPIADFVTPLKKRRLARESLSAEGPYPPTPSTPSGAGFSHSLDHEDTSQHSNSGETSQQAVSASSSHRNGFQPHHFSPLTPVTPSDNLFERFEGDDMKSQGSSSAREPLVNGKSPSLEAREDEEADGECSEELVSPDSAASDIGDTDCKRPDTDAQCDSTMGVLRNSTCDSACVLETIAEEPSESQQSSSVQTLEDSDSPTAHGGLPCTTCTDPKIVVESSDSTGSCQPDQTSAELADTTSISPGPSSQSNLTVSVSSASVSASSDSSSSCQMNDLPYETPVADSSETATSGADLPPQPSGSSHLDASTGVSGSPSQGCVVAGPSNSECSEFRQEETMDVGDSSRTEPSSSNELVHHKETDQCSVMACSSSSPNNKICAEISSEVLPVVSHSTDSTDCSGATVSTSQDSNSSILVCDSVDNEVKEDCSAEISSSKGPIVFREEESELEEGEIVSSEDELDVCAEGEKSKCENADSSSSNAVSNRHRQVSGESATSSSSSHEEQNDVCSGSGELEESERVCWPTCSQVDSTSCHSTKESLVNSGVDSTVSGRELEGGVVISSNQTDSGVACACPASSSVTSLTDTSSNSVPCSSSQVSQASSASSKAAAQGKKKVSLLEYRQRMRLKSQDSPSPGCSRGGGTKASGSNSNTAGPSSVTLAPLPLFDCSPAQEATPRPPRDPFSLPGQKEAKEDTRWTVSATLAERHRENAQMSLTERLRKEFGLSDDSEDDENKERHKSSPRRPKQLPPPPPPPPNNLPPPPPPPIQIAAGGPGVVFHPGVVGTPSPGVPPLPPPPVAIGAAPRVPPPPVSPVVSVQSNIMPVAPPAFGGIPPPPPPHVVTPAGPPPVPSLPPPPVTQTSVAGGRPASHAIPPLMSLPSYPTKHFSSNLVSGRPGTPGAGQSPAASVPAQPFPPAPGPPPQGYQFQQGEAANGSEVFPPVVFEEQAETSSASQVYQQPMAFIEQVEPASSQQFTGYTQPPPSYVETPGEGTEPSSTSGPYQYPMVPQPPNIASTQSQNSQHNPHSLLNISKSQRQQ